MDSAIYRSMLIKELVKHKRKQRTQATRPIFVFCCGGNLRDYHARAALTHYVKASKRSELRNVFFLVAENLADREVFPDFDLLVQEAIIADVSDAIILFAESVGSFCELGAFAALPHISSIMAVGVDKHHTSPGSFLIDGPARMIEESKLPLNEVFALDLNCPLDSPDFSAFVHGIREKVVKNESAWMNRDRKKLNTDQQRVGVGALVHELLDLVYLFGPISRNDLIDLYCKVRGFQRSRVTIQSLTLVADMKIRNKKILFDQVISFMEAVEIIRQLNDDCPDLVTDLELEQCFMFRKTDSSSFNEAISKVALAKRHRSREGYKSVYRRFDIS